MRNVHITRAVKLTLTADDWQLYDFDGRDAAAIAINTGVEKALNAGNPEAAYDVLREFRAFGAADTEGETMLLYIMRKMQ